ncbi:MAG: NUDIX domain-containing protein [Candidatus Thermoplasmatota archaeon]|nr:NUDIX domain-containing protein [Candidatus Thermoplasmatota archaeon]
MEYTVVVALIPDGRFMMIKHKKRGWEWPGGKLHSGETPIECARREILEETGYELIAPKLIMETGNGEGEAKAAPSTDGKPSIVRDSQSRTCAVKDSALAAEIGKGYVIFAKLGKKVCEISDEMTERVEFFEELPEKEKLSFPHDPYDEVLAKLKKFRKK